MFPGALVTGSTSGIGLAIAVSMSKMGMNVMVHGSSAAFHTGRGWPLPGDHNNPNVHTFTTFEQEADHAVKMVRAAAKYPDQQKITFTEADLSKSHEVEGLMHTTISQFNKGLSVLVNNAGIHVKPSPFSTPRMTPDLGHAAKDQQQQKNGGGSSSGDSAPPETQQSSVDGTPIEGIELSQWGRVMQVNLTAPFQCMQLALPLMKRQEFGRIINIAGPHGLVGVANKSAYVASKHGLIGLTKSAALEGGPHGITVNAVCPGFVQSPSVERTIEKKMQETGSDFETTAAEMIAEETPMVQFVGADEVAGAVAFFSLPSSKSTNGSILSIDGGYVAH